MVTTGTMIRSGNAPFCFPFFQRGLSNPCFVCLVLFCFVLACSFCSFFFYVRLLLPIYLIALPSTSFIFGSQRIIRRALEMALIYSSYILSLCSPSSYFVSSLPQSPVPHSPFPMPQPVSVCRRTIHRVLHRASTRHRTPSTKHRAPSTFHHRRVYALFP